MKKIALLLVSATALTASVSVTSAQPMDHLQYAQHRHHDDRRHPGAHQRHNERAKVRHHRKGGVLGHSYRRNVINNHRNYGLRRPGRGESWVRVNDQFLLISSSGRILAVAPRR